MKHLLILLVGATLFLTGCSNEDGGAGTLSTTAPMEAKFDLTASVIPFPTNILFSGSTDGTLNIPSIDPTDFSDPKVAMNALDGFSTIAPISTTFSHSIDPATIAAGVRVFEVTTAGILNSYAVTGITAELVAGSQYAALPSPSDASTLVIKPIIPLKANTNYMVVVTSALKSTAGVAARTSLGFELLKKTTELVDASGGSLVPGSDDATAAQLEGLRQLTAAMLAVSASATPSIAATDVALAWSFKTQTLKTVLTKIQTNSATDPYATNAASFLAPAATPSVGTGGLGVLPFYSFAQAAAAGGNSALLDAYTASPTSFDTLGSVVIGAAKLPYYLDDNTVAGAPLITRFQVDSYGAPTLKSVQTVPFLITIPNTAAPAGLGNKWPVVIFQHGFTSDKSAMFGIANTLAKAGFATIAIDSVLHGDRTFGVDFANNTTGDAGADGIADTSGKHYLNLSYLLTTRDNARQSVADLIHLTRLLEVQTMDVVANGTGLPTGSGDGADLVVGTPPASFIGHSNGAILGTVLATVEPAVKTFVLANPGGDYASILDNSLAFGPVVRAGLAASGVTADSAEYQSFLVAAQTVVDDADAINYAQWAKATGGPSTAKALLVFKTLDDGVVPNAQTDALLLTMNIKQVAATPALSTWPLGAVAAPSTLDAFTFFTQGTHSSFLTPEPVGLVGADVITEMQSQAANFLGSALIGPATITIGATALPSTNAASTVVQ